MMMPVVVSTAGPDRVSVPAPVFVKLLLPRPVIVLLIVRLLSAQMIGSALKVSVVVKIVLGLAPKLRMGLAELGVVL